MQLKLSAFIFDLKPFLCSETAGVARSLTLTCRTQGVALIGELNPVYSGDPDVPRFTHTSEGQK